MGDVNPQESERIPLKLREIAQAITRGNSCDVQCTLGAALLYASGHSCGNEMAYCVSCGKRILCPRERNGMEGTGTDGTRTAKFGSTDRKVKPKTVRKFGSHCFMKNDEYMDCRRASAGFLRKTVQFYSPKRNKTAKIMGVIFMPVFRQENSRNRQPV